MKKFLILAVVLTAVLLAATEVASAHPRRGGGFAGGAVIYRAPVVSYRSYRLSYRWPSYLNSNRYWNRGPYWRYRNYYSGYGYMTQPLVYSSHVVPTTTIVMVKPAKPKPEIPITKWDDNDLETLVLNKFLFARGLDRSGNKVAMEIVSKDFHGDTGALKKVKFQVRWVEIKISRAKDGKEIGVEKEKKDTVKLKFDGFGRFTSYDD